VYEDIINFGDYKLLDLNIEMNTPLNPPDASGGFLFHKYDDIKY